MQLFLAAAPAEVREASRFTRSLVHVAYNISNNSFLRLQYLYFLCNRTLQIYLL